MVKNLYFIAGLRDIEIHHHNYLNNEIKKFPLYFDIDNNLFDVEQLQQNNDNSDFINNINNIYKSNKKVIEIEGHVHLNLFHDILQQNNKDPHVDHFKLPFKSFLLENENKFSHISSGYTIDPTKEITSYLSGINSKLDKESLQIEVLDSIVDFNLSPLGVYLSFKDRFGHLIDFENTVQKLTGKSYSEVSKEQERHIEKLIQLSFENQTQLLSNDINSMPSLSTLKNKLILNTDEKANKNQNKI